MNAATRWIKSHKLLVSLLVLGAIAAGVAFRLRAKQLQSETLSGPLQRGTIVESVYGIGTVTATRSFQLKFGTTGTIRKLFIREGDSIKRGDPLAVVDTTTFNAPFDGTITSLPFKEGENVFAQSIILSLVDLSDRYLVVSLEQRGALRVRVGQKAKISFDSMRGETFDGAVQSVYSNDNNFLVRIGVSSFSPQILPGMTADVAIGIDERNNVLLAPVAAIENGKVSVSRGRGFSKTIPVKTGIVDGAMAEIVAGDVKEGDLLVIRGKTP